MPKSPPIRLHVPILLGVALLAGQLVAQETPDPPKEPDPTPPVSTAPETPPTEEPPAPTEPEDAPPPSLDDLLGIEEGEDADDTEAVAEAERQRALDRALDEEKPDDAFKSAVSDMQESANLLRDNQSTGLGTQRLQTRIIERLQILIDSARKQQQNQQQSSSSSSSSSSQQQDPGQQSQSQQPEGSEQQNADPSETTAGNPPGFQEAVLDGEIEETGMEWGNLPPRVRERITQGMRDRVSELYRSLTEAYYRRMAEEAS